MNKVLIILLLSVVLSGCVSVGTEFSYTLPKFITDTDIENFRKSTFYYVKDKDLATKISKCYVYKLANNKRVNECSESERAFKKMCFNKNQSDVSLLLNCTPLFNISTLLGNTKMRARANKKLISKFNYIGWDRKTKEERLKPSYVLMGDAMVQGYKREIYCNKLMSEMRKKNKYSQSDMSAGLTNFARTCIPF